MTLKDAKGHTTTYTYDGFGRQRRTTFPNTMYEELSYDAMGNVTSKLARGGQLIVNTYDSLDRLATHLVPQPGAAPAILTTTTYDLAGRVTAIGDNTGHSLTYAFDTAKRPSSVTQAAPTFSGTRVVSHQLDQNGNRTRTTWADGYYVQYAYDALNRMTTATENGTFLLATYIHDPLSRRSSLVYGNGTTQGYTYTTQGDLLTLASTLSGTSNTFTNTFTKAHQLSSENASNAAWRYAPATFQTTAYSAANNLNQYVTITAGANPAVTMAYDANGNLTGDGTWTFAYDAKNMLRSAAKSGGSASYQYDPLGRRQMLTENGTTTTFLHDGDEEIADYASTTVLRRYVPGPGTDMPIAMVTPSGGPNTRKYFHPNRQGSTIAMSADNGTLGEGPYTYDAYGNGAPTTGVPFKYTGRRLDPGTGLYYYRARYYAASLGRFLQTDPVGYADQMNLYGYVSNDPANKVDPTGNQEAYSYLWGECQGSASCEAQWVARQPQDVAVGLGGGLAGAGLLYGGAAAGGTLADAWYASGAWVSATAPWSIPVTRFTSQFFDGAEAATPAPIAAVAVPSTLKAGTTLFGDSVHAGFDRVMKELYPNTKFSFALSEGARGPDVRYVGGEFPGFNYGELSRMTEGGMTKYLRQVERWWDRGDVPRNTDVKPFWYNDNGVIFE